MLSEIMLTTEQKLKLINTCGQQSPKAQWFHITSDPYSDRAGTCIITCEACLWHCWLVSNIPDFLELIWCIPSRSQYS